MAKTSNQAVTEGAATVDAVPQTGEQVMLGLMGTPLAEEIETHLKDIYGDKTRGWKDFGEFAEWVASTIDTIGDRELDEIDGMIASIDQTLTEQVNAIMHHPDFQRLEGTWRGLQRLVMNSELNTELRIRVLNITKEEMLAEFRTFKGAKWDESALFRKIYTQEFGLLNGKPYGCVIGDFEFGPSAADVDVLRGMAKIASHAHAPFLAAAAPAMMKMESWAELNLPPNLEAIFQSDDYAPWRSFRGLEDSRYVGLTLPRVLARRPYGGPGGDTVEDFHFTEDVGAGPEGFCWTNSAFALAENINRSFTLYGWATQIRGVESGGMVEDLPCYTYSTSDGGVDMTCPTEIPIPYARDNQLSKLGFMALCHAKGENWAAFIGGQSAHEPREYDDAEATKNSRLTGKLPYMFALSRFAHFLKKMVYLKIGTPMTRNQIEAWLNDWVSQYVLLNPDGSPASLLAEKPLSAAQVVVTESEDDPGTYAAVFRLQPHFQLERIDVALRLVSRVPKTQQNQ